MIVRLVEAEEKKGASIIVVLATDAQLHPLQLQRLAKRATVGLARVGRQGHNQSGDISLAFSTASEIPVQTVLLSPAWFSISILPIRLINIVTNQYWRVLASIGHICNICRSSWHPIIKF